jgi:hypothetical protein
LGQGGGGAVGYPGGAGGGGGGGLYGGGGGGPGGGFLNQNTTPPTADGAGGAGGGGGSSGAPSATVSDFRYLPTAPHATPEVLLSPAPRPVEVTGAATGVTATSATVNGTVNPSGVQLSDCHFVISPAPAGGPTAACAQQVPVGDSPVSVSAVLLGLRPSKTYTVTLVAATLAGQTGGAPVRFNTLPPAPVITKLKVRSGPRMMITLKLSQQASLKLTFARKKGKKYVVVGASMSARGRKGANKIRFGGRGLKPGSYRVTVVATNSVHESSSPARATFMLV